MKPEVVSPQLSSEQSPNRPPDQGIERTPQLQSPETGIETGAERKEHAVEPQAATAGAGIPLVLPMPVLTDDITLDDSSNSLTSAPIVAADEDLIEKEWVDRAKKIVTETKDDPYKREAEVSRLQVDYLRKRYGREPGAAN